MVTLFNNPGKINRKHVETSEITAIRTNEGDTIN